MSRLYKRTFALTFARLQPGEFFPGGTTNGITVGELRIAFEIEKTLKSEPNTATISVWNLAPTTRTALEYKPTSVRLEVGYDGETRRLIEGDIRFARSKRDGVDWVTEMQIADGDRAFRFARVNRSFQGGVSARTAVLELIKAMGLTAPRNFSTFTSLRDQYVSGLTLFGEASTELTRILSPHGIGWSIQGGALQMLRDTDVRVDQYVPVNQTTGMVGSPTFGTPEKRGAKPTLTVNMLIDPGLTPGGRIKVTSETATGIFKLYRVVSSGDSFGDSWFTTVEAKQV